MNLREYCAKYEIKNYEISKKIGYDVGYISAIKTGRFKAGPKFAKAIEKLTKGEVSQEELYAMYKGKKK